MRIKTFACYTAVTLLLASTCLTAFAQKEMKLTREEMYGLVESNNISLRKQITQNQASAEGVTAAIRQQLPDISLTADVSYIGNAVLTDRDLGNARGFSSPHYGNHVALNLSQPVYTGGAMTAAVEMAKAGKRQSDIAVEYSRQSLRIMVLGQYLDIMKTDNSLRVVDANIALAQKLISDSKELQRQGMALKNDVTRFELQLKSLELRRLSLQNQRTVLNHTLCNSLGLDTATTILPADRDIFAARTVGGEDVWKETAQSGSLPLKMEEAKAEMSRQKVRMARSEMLPQVKIVACNDFNGPITYELPPVDKNINIWYVGIGMHMPLSALYKNNRKVRQAKLEAQAAREAVEAGSLSVDNAMQEAYRQYILCLQETDTKRKSAELARQNYEVIRQRYVNQLATTADMTDATNIRLQAELDEVDAQINTAYAYHRMEYVAGRM